MMTLVGKTVKAGNANPNLSDGVSVQLVCSIKYIYVNTTKLSPINLISASRTLERLVYTTKTTTTANTHTIGTNGPRLMSADNAKNKTKVLFLLIVSPQVK